MYYEVFKELCEERGVRPSDVSKATGISTATLTNWKQGKYTPKEEKLRLIADYFGVQTRYLRTGDKAFAYAVDRDLVEAIKKAGKEKSEKAALRGTLIEKFSMLTKDDQIEIIDIIDMKLSRYKEKEKQDLA